MQRTDLAAMGAALILTVLVAPSGEARAQEPLGGEFRANPFERLSFRPDVAANQDGDFLVVWRMILPPPQNTQMFAKRYDASGNALGSEFVITPEVSGGTPRVASIPGGGYVVFWVGNEPGVLSNGVYARRYDGSGVPVGSELLVNTYTRGNQDNPAVAADGGGNFVVVWESQYQDGSGEGVFGQRFDADGQRLGVEFQVNTYTTDHQAEPEVAADAAGTFVIVWQSYGQDGHGWGVYGQRYDAAGIPLAGEFLVNDPTFGTQWIPDVAADADGDFVVVYQRSNGYALQDIFARRFDASGTALGGEFRVNTYTTDYQELPRVASAADGDLVVVWESEGQDGSLDGIYAQQFDAGGTPRGGEFRVNTFTNLRQQLPAVASDEDGDFVVVWEKVDMFEGTNHVKGQRYAGPGLHLDAGGTCPGPVSLSIVNAPPDTEVALVPGANTNGFVKGGNLCPATRLEVGEPFQLPPTFVIVDGEGRGSAVLELGANRCFVEALALKDCQTSGAVAVPPATEVSD